jgi:TDG/mug DNA glycosylase family protein
MLPDLLAPNLKLVICGSAAGQKSADVGHYYAGPGNALWRTLFETGLTPRELLPAEWEQLLEHGIGLTDLVKDQSGADSGIRFGGGADLRKKMRKYQPGMLVFNGKRAAQEYFQLTKVEYGLLPSMIDKTKLFVAPSTSGAARGSWDPRYWQAMAKFV